VGLPALGATAVEVRLHGLPFAAVDSVAHGGVDALVDLCADLGKNDCSLICAIQGNMEVNVAAAQPHRGILQGPGGRVWLVAILDQGRTQTDDLRLALP